MKSIILFSLLVCTYGAYYEEIAKKTIEEQKNQPGSFQAGYNEYLRGKSKEQIKRLMGTKLDKKGRVRAPVKAYKPEELTDLPAQFTAGIDKWPKCASTIGYIKDQADCGSCWAVAASEVVADRICIGNYASIPGTPEFLNEGRPLIDMSAEQIMDCCTWCGAGCGGGYPIDAMRYWSWNGVVTGGWYGSNCGCMPYQMPPCPASGCSGNEPPNPACTQTCRSNYRSSFSQDLHYAQDYFEIQETVAQIQQEIYNNGPVECGFQVYANLMSYKSGVYDNLSGEYLGGHAIKVIGWGVEKGTPYWLINNSWNVTWGMNGQFKFLAGQNLGGIESACVGAMAKTPDSNFLLQCQ